MYWIHRIGRRNKSDRGIDFDALCYLLEERTCLTIGWQYFANDTDIVAAVQSGNFVQVRNLLKQKGELEQQSRGIVNFSQFKVGDIVVVLPIINRMTDIFIVEVKTAPQSILNISNSSQKAFSAGGHQITFNPNIGFVYPNGALVDVGFFCEVAILNRESRSIISSQLKDFCDKTRFTTRKIDEILLQRYIHDTLIPTKFYSRITRP